MENKGLCVKIAVTDGETPAGMIEYVPIAHVHAEGLDLCIVNCI